MAKYIRTKAPEVEAQLKEIAARPSVTVPWDRITINRWRPDTCRCVLEQWFDDDAKPRVITYARIVSICPEHTATDLALFAAVYGENTRKNAMLGVVANLLSLDPDSVLNRASWSFDDTRIAGTDERVLRMAISKATNPERNSIQSSADTRFGPGTVVVEVA